jgi:hypothetical protein
MNAKIFSVVPGLDQYSTVIPFAFATL